MGAKRESRTNAWTLSEKTEVNARRCRNRRPCSSVPKNSGIPNTRERPSASHAASMCSISDVSIATSSDVATREKRRNPCSSRKSRCSGVTAGPSVKRVVSGRSVGIAARHR